MDSLKKYIKQLRNLVTWINNKSPIHSNFLVILFLIVLFNLLYSVPEQASRFSDLFKLLLKILNVSMLLLVLISFTSVIVPYIKIRKKNIVPIIEFKYPEKYSESFLFFVISYKVIRPIGGYIRIELNFINKFTSPQFTLWKKRENEESLYYGKFSMELPEIRHYDLIGTTVYFEDFFRFFSLKQTIEVKGSVSSFPIADSKLEYTSTISNHKEEIYRTEIVHPKEGEWLHFKNFEPSDDIRRIIWPIYAKNKQLIVRKQELQNMFASELTLMPLFSNYILDLPVSEKLNSEFLNQYKKTIWSLILSLESSKEIEVRLLSDQQLVVRGVEDISPTLNKLTGMQWLASEEVFSSASVYCVSSLTPIEELEKLNLDTLSDIVFVKLSKNFKTNILSLFPRNIFFQVNKEDHNLFEWWKSPYRKSVLSNERKIKEYFEDKVNKFIEL